jgi:hypothetical protein
MNSRIVALALGLTLALVLAAPALAATPTTIAFGGASTTRVAGQLALTARLADATGKPIGEREIAFYQRVDFFGSRDAYIATATTDADGTATIVYEPAEAGQQGILVRFAGDTTYAEASAPGSIDVKDAAAPFAEAPLPLASVRGWLPFVLGAFVLATWLALLGIFWRAISGIRAAGPVVQSEPSTLSPRADGIGD